MISDGTGTKGLNYWLANKSTEALDFNYVTYFVCAIRGGMVWGQNMHIDMYNEGYTAPFRPVVILSNDVNFESNSQSEHSSETSAWSIK